MGTTTVFGPHRARQERQQENSEFRMVNMERQKWLTADGQKMKKGDRDAEW
jgi:hypothetical protein